MFLVSSFFCGVNFVYIVKMEMSFGILWLEEIRSVITEFRESLRKKKVAD